jgi:hypothetical protein
MPIAPVIDRLAFLPAAELTEALTLFRSALAPLGTDLLLNRRIDGELPRLANGNSRISPQLITHLFEWTDSLEAFSATRASADADFAARWRRLTEPSGSSAHPLFPALRRTGRDMEGMEATPLVSRLRGFFEKCPEVSSWPVILEPDSRPIPAGDRSRLEAVLQDLFGRSVLAGEFLNAFHVDVPGYRLAMLVLDRESTRVLVTGRLAKDGGDDAGAFQRAIALPPPVGGEWRAVTTGYNPMGGFDSHTRRGLARGLHQRFLGFLHRLGVDRLYLRADKSGHYVWPHLGFRHRDAKETECLKDIFREYLEILDLWSADVEGRWTRIGESWDLADFTVGNEKIGKNFLLSLEGKIGQNLYFEVGDLKDAGWSRLFQSSG